MADAPLSRAGADAVTARMSSSVWRLPFISSSALPSWISCTACGGRLAMANVDELERPDIEIMLPGNGFDPLGGTDENRNEVSFAGRTTAERALVAWVHHGAPHRRDLLGAIDQAIIFRLVVRHHALALRLTFASAATLDRASTPNS